MQIHIKANHGHGRMNVCPVRAKNSQHNKQTNKKWKGRDGRDETSISEHGRSTLGRGLYVAHRNDVRNLSSLRTLLAFFFFFFFFLQKKFFWFCVVWGGGFQLG